LAKRSSLARYWSIHIDAAQRGLSKREITGSETMDPKSTAVVLIEYHIGDGSGLVPLANNINHLSRYFH
jgi:hypothetical protein